MEITPEQKLRLDALHYANQAQIHNAANSGPDSVLETAEKYYEFLTGSSKRP